MPLTLRQVIDQIKAVADAHAQINGVGVGDFAELQSQTRVYPLFWIFHERSEVIEGYIVRRIRLLCADRVQTGQEGDDDDGMEIEVLSDTQRILMDFIAYFAQQHNQAYIVDRVGSIDPFTERFDDRVAGNTVLLTIKEAWDYSKCETPIGTVNIPPTVDGLTLYDFGDASVLGRLTAQQVADLQAAYGSICADATITINSSPYGTVPSGGTENIIVESENNNPLGSLVGGNWEVGNAHLRVNGTTVGNLEPEQWHDHYATINGTQAGSWHNPSQTWRMNVLQGGSPVGSLSGTDWVVPACADATAVLKNTANTTLSTTSIASGASANITAPDATAVLKNTANTTLLTEAIPSNVSENITAPDGTYLHRDSAGNSIGSGSIMSGQIGVIIIAPDGSYSLRDTASNVLATGNIRSNQTGVVITAPDGTYSLRNTAGTVLGTGSIRSGQLSVVITAPDATITLNGSAYGSAPSGTTFNVDTQTITPLTTTNILTSFGFKQSIAGTTPNLFRFRKNTGGTEFNVAADANGYPDVTTAQTNLGADSAFLVRVYDLSGNSRDAYWTASTTPQPRLAMAAGASKRQIQAAHITNQYMQCDCPITAGQAWTLYMALTPNEMAGGIIACGGTGATFKWWINTDSLNRVYLYDGVSQNPVTSNYSVVQRAPMVLAVQFKTNELRVYANGTLILSHNTWSVLASSMFQIARRVDGGGSIGQFNWNGIAAYTGDYSSSINTAFTNIYQP